MYGRVRGLQSYAAAVAAMAVAMPGGPVAAQPGDLPVAGPPAVALTLQGAAREAVGWHPSLTQAAGVLAARGEEIAVARAGYLPQISAGIGSGYDSRIATGWRPRPQVGASQMLFDFGRVASNVDGARAGERAGRAELLLAVDALVRDSSYAVIEYQRAVALRQVAADQLASIGAIERLVRDRFELGGTTRSDAIQAQARVEAAAAMLSQIDAEQRRWASNLAYLLGREAIGERVSPEVPAWLMQGCTRAGDDIAVAPGVMLAEAQQQRANADLKRTRAERYPALALGGEASSDIASPFGERSIYNVGLRVTGNVFGGNTGARVRSAGFAVQAAQANVVRARNDARQRLAEARQQIASLTQLGETLVSRQENMRLTGELYRLQYLEMGTRTLVDLLNAQQELHQVRFDSVNTAHDIRRLNLDCIFHSGRIRDAFGLAGTTVRGVML